LALDGISFQIQQGEKVAIIGPNGAGKSTLIFLLNGTLNGSGNIWIDDEKIDPKKVASLHKKIGVVFQNPDDQLFCPTLYDDVAFGPLNLGLGPEEINRRVLAALALVGLEGYENRSNLNLSFGERKSASLATVLAMQPDIYIFDEPSSNLDPFQRRKIINQIIKLNKTILIATHDLDLVAETCTGILLLNKGKLIRQGGIDLVRDKVLLESNHLELPYRFAHGRDY
jgi:cobalt/nickel transport system ATP-binding protein